MEAWIGLEYDEDEDEWYIIEFFDDGDEADRWYRRVNGFIRFEYVHQLLPDAQEMTILSVWIEPNINP